MSLVGFGCGGSPAPPPAGPSSEPGPTAADTAEANAPPAPRRVAVSKVEIQGGGVDEAAVRKGLESQGEAFESCYAATLEATPEAAGRMILSYLFVKGERKSVSASHSGPGSATLNDCFQKAANNVTLAVDTAAERSSITVYLEMSKDAG